MIIREAFDDVRRFSEFQMNPVLAKNILAARLKHLVDIGVFEICPASDGSAYKDYILTERGRSVFPIVVAMRQWGERYLFEQGEINSVLLDKVSNEPLPVLEVCSSQGVVTVSALLLSLGERSDFLRGSRERLSGIGGCFVPGADFAKGGIY